MSEKNITRVSSADLPKMRDRTKTDPPESPALDREFWAGANVVFPDAPKQQLTVRFDADVVEWFKAQGRGYQTRMNAVLRSFYEARRDDPQ